MSFSIDMYLIDSSNTSIVECTDDNFNSINDLEWHITLSTFFTDSQQFICAKFEIFKPNLRIPSK